MAVKVRMTRKGNKHNPFYRIVVADERFPRDGRYIEQVGTYDPRQEKEADKATLKTDRIDYWVSKGAQLSDTVSRLVNREKKAASAAEK